MKVLGTLQDKDGKDFEADGHTHSKSEVGLSNVDNTSDLAKPISTATQTALNNIRVGGTNLLNGTDDTTEYSGTWISGYHDTTYFDNLPILDELEYTVSFYARSTNATQNIICHFWDPNTTISATSSTGQFTNNIDGYCEVTITNVKHRYWVTWKQSASGSTKKLIVGRLFSEGTVYISGIKFEKGNKATDWSPAPEDNALSVHTHAISETTGLQDALDGKLPTSGGSVTGVAYFKQGTLVHNSNASPGTAGYINIARITITASYTNQPIVIELVQRGHNQMSTLEVLFQNQNSSDPPLLSFVKTGQVNAYIHHFSAGIWDIYVQKTEAWDVVDIVNYKKGAYMISNLSVSWMSAFAVALPTSDITTASLKTIYTNISGNAATHAHTKSQITDMPTKLSQFENDIGVGGGAVISTTTGTITTTWTGSAVPYTQTISNAAVTASATCIVEVSLSPTATVTEADAWDALNLKDGGQTAGSFTLRCFGDLNTIAIPIVMTVIKQ